MSPVLVRPDRPSIARRDPRRILAAVLVALAIAVMLPVLATLLRGPDRVSRVGIENRGTHLVDVEVTGAGHDGWLGLAAVRPGERFDVHDVVDVGDRWTFHFTSGPHEGGEVTLTRDELARTGWRVDIPAPVESRLSAEGAPPYSG
jgi:hypothetical protein